jgi:hypothetical protein
MARVGGLSRRGLFGAGLAGAAALSGLQAQRALAGEDVGDTGPLAPGERPNALIVVMDRMRADFVGAYDDQGHTPHLDRLADHALRFEQVVPEALPAPPVRRAVLTGMRSYPFRDWRAVDGIPAIPGWNPIWPGQPLLPERVALDGLNAVVVSDDPLLGGARMDPFLKRTTTVPSLEGCDDPSDDPCGTCLRCLGADTSRVPGYLTPLQSGLRAAPDPTERVMTKAIAELEQLRTRQPFLLVVDVFDPATVAAPPVAFVDGERTVSDIFTPGRLEQWRRVDVRVSDETAREVRRRYRDQQTANDAQLGRLLDRLDDVGLGQRTFVMVLSDGGVSLGEHGVWGHPQGVGMHEPFEVPLLMRDPHGRRAGDSTGYRASTHDVAPTVLSRLGLGRPGRMEGEDLTAFLDDEDPPHRNTFNSMIGTTAIVGDDDDYMLVADLEQQQRQVFDDDGDNETSGESSRLASLWSTAVAAAGGTMPEFGDDGPLRPRYPADDQELLRDLGKDRADTD